MQKAQARVLQKIGNTVGRAHCARLSNSPSRSELDLMVTAAHNNKQVPPQDVPSRPYRDLVYLDYLLLSGFSHIASRVSNARQFLRRQSIITRFTLALAT